MLLNSYKTNKKYLMLQTYFQINLKRVLWRILNEGGFIVPCSLIIPADLQCKLNTLWGNQVKFWVLGISRQVKQLVIKLMVTAIINITYSTSSRIHTRLQVKSPWSLVERASLRGLKKVWRSRESSWSTPCLIAWHAFWIYWFFHKIDWQWIALCLRQKFKGALSKKIIKEQSSWFAIHQKHIFTEYIPTIRDWFGEIGHFRMSWDDRAEFDSVSRFCVAFIVSSCIATLQHDANPILLLPDFVGYRQEYPSCL